MILAFGFIVTGSIVLSVLESGSFARTTELTEYLRSEYPTEYRSNEGLSVLAWDK
ncbi:hypothetical protein IJH89_00400 [Candidatus Saccharibacteria bacterium]|nr:hypothetical protein [Candidatus Saccharibacteria bacterium]